MEPLISVVIPFYKRIDWLKEAVQSVVDQTYNNWEIIIINDGSIEDDSFFLNDFKYNLRYFVTENKGPASARNLGIELALGEYIAFLDSDDLWMPQKMEIQINHMKEKGLTWSHTSYNLFNDSNGKTLKKIEVGNFKGDVFSQCLISSPIATPCVMIKTKFLKENPEIRFSENMRYGQDGYMWLNIARFQKLGVLDLPLTRVRMRGTNAKLKARVHLQVKGQMWIYLKDKAKTDKKYSSLPLLVKIAYRLGYINYLLLQFIEKRGCRSSTIRENLSKILYTPTYLILNLNRTK